MLRATFRQVIEATRAEARLSTNTSRGTDHLDYIKQVIRRNYEMLSDIYSWQHLRLPFSGGLKTLEAGERYYDFPPNLNIGKIERVAALHSQVEWVDVEYGIGIDEMNSFDSEADERADPPQRWDFESNLQFEIWPIPQTAGRVVFRGQRKIEELETDDNRLDIDDILVTLFSASEILAGTKQTDAESKLQAAKERLAQLRADYSPKTVVRVGMEQPEVRRQGRIMYVRSAT